jgi:hypothetical protein
LMDGAARHEITYDVSQSSHRRAAETALLVLALRCDRLLSAVRRLAISKRGPTGASYATGFFIDRPQRQVRTSTTFPARSWWCFSASPNARTCSFTMVELAQVKADGR